MDNLSTIFAGKVPGVKKMDESKVVNVTNVKDVDINSKIYGNVLGRGGSIFDVEKRARAKNVVSTSESKPLGLTGKSEVNIKEIIGTAGMSEKKLASGFDVGNIIGIGKTGSFKPFNVQNVLFGTSQRVKAGSRIKNVPKEVNVESIIFGTAKSGRTAQSNVHNILYGSNKQLGRIMGDTKSKGLNTNKNKIQQMIGSPGGAYNNKIQKILGNHTGPALGRFSESWNSEGRIRAMLGHTPRFDIYGRNAEDPSIQMTHSGDTATETRITEGATAEEIKLLTQPLEVYPAETPVEKVGYAIGTLSGVPKGVKKGVKELTGDYKTGYKEGYRSTAGVYPYYGKAKTEGGQTLLQKTWQTVKSAPATMARGATTVGRTLGGETAKFFGVETQAELTPEELQYVTAIAAQRGIPVETAVASARQVKGSKGGVKQKTGQVFYPGGAAAGGGQQEFLKVMASYMSRKGATPEGAQQLYKMYRSMGMLGEREKKSPFRQFTSSIGGGISDITQSMPSVEQAAVRLLPPSTEMGIRTAVSGVGTNPLTPSRASALIGGTGGGRFFGYYDRYLGNRGTMTQSPIPVGPEPIVPQSLLREEQPYEVEAQPVSVQVMPQAGAYPVTRTSQRGGPPRPGMVWSESSHRWVGYTRNPYKPRNY